MPENKQPAVVVAEEEEEKSSFVMINTMAEEQKSQ